MQIALIADLHGNRPATLALERDLERVKPDLVYCLGDIVGKGPCSDFTFDWAQEHCDLILGGNWDYGIGDRFFPADTFYWKQLGDKRLAALRKLPKEYEFWFSGRRIRMLHGRPVMDTLITAQHEKAEIEPYFAAKDGGRYGMVIYADAHRQAMRTMSPGMFVNIGSVGNAMGEPKCCYAILTGDMGPDAQPLDIRFRQVDYDRARAVADAHKTPQIPNIAAFIREVETGIYSRNLK